MTRWYRFKATPFVPPKSSRDATEELLTLYKQAVRRQLMSDVPVGLLLSGGVDSGMLLALMNLNGSSWPTFSVGYGSSYADDELLDAQDTAHLLASKHTAVTITRSTFEETVAKVVESLEEPIAASSIIPMYFVCSRASQDVKVALIGQGPDELFGGYRRHLGVRYGALWAGVPRWLRDPISSGIAALPRNETLKRGLYSLAIRDRMHRYQHVLSIMPGETVDGLFHEGVLDGDAGDIILECWKDLADSLVGTDELGGLQLLEVQSTLPDELLMYADKLSMVHGLELRVPYLDKDVVEYVQRLPAVFKVRNGSRKWLHRKVCRAYLPDSILKRKKRGFAVNVVDSWFRNLMNNKLADSLLDNGALIYQYLRPAAVRALFDQHASGRNDNHKILFSLIVCEQWLRANNTPAAALY
jgi:asparagine synthase (glutamine-hydrolysing)